MNLNFRLYVETQKVSRDWISTLSDELGVDKTSDVWGSLNNWIGNVSVDDGKMKKKSPGAIFNIIKLNKDNGGQVVSATIKFSQMSNPRNYQKVGDEYVRSPDKEPISDKTITVSKETLDKMIGQGMVQDTGNSPSAALPGNELPPSTGVPIQ